MAPEGRGGERGGQRHAAAPEPGAHLGVALLQAAVQRPQYAPEAGPAQAAQWVRFFLRRFVFLPDHDQLSKLWLARVEATA
jgi:hypothetical protein